MRKTLLMAGALLAMTATFANAAGLELAWNQCFGQAGAASLRTSACNSNTGQQAMYASFRPPPGQNQLEGLDVFVDFQTSGGSLDCWWDMSIGNPTRNSALVSLHVSPADANGVPLITCDNHYFLDAGASGGGGMVVTAADRGQMKGFTAIAAGTGQPVAAEAQQYGFGFRITNANTLSCTGCQRSACFVLNTINMTSVGVPPTVIQSPHPGSENWVTFNGDGASTNCPGSTPTRNATWGSLKSLYR